METKQPKIEVTSRRTENGARPRIYVWPAKETILENLETRHDRPIEEWRKLIPSILTAAGVTDPTGVKVSWSQKAGCRCGCSPGFVVKDNGWKLPGDLFVTVGG